MSIFKVLAVCSKEVIVETVSGHTYLDEVHAYSEYQYFSTLEKAQAFCQQYIPDPIEWIFLSDDCWYVETDIANFNIYVEKDAEYDTPTKPPLPTKFATRVNQGD